MNTTKTAKRILIARINGNDVAREYEVYVPATLEEAISTFGESFCLRKIQAALEIEARQMNRADMMHSIQRDIELTGSRY